MISQIDFDHLMTPALRSASQGFQLHKIASQRIGTEEFQMADALRAIGEKLFLKNAEYKNILLGLKCLSELERGE
jgi:gamma-glutamyltranspeptidase